MNEMCLLNFKHIEGFSSYSRYNLSYSSQIGISRIEFKQSFCLHESINTKFWYLGLGFLSGFHHNLKRRIEI